ncbi:MAG: hypothetical protein ACP6IP_06175 [Candidatus Njordarchaeia archaeon]
MTMVEILEKITNSTELDELLKHLELLYRSINFDTNVPKKIVENLEKKGFSNLLSLYHAFRKAGVERLDDVFLELIGKISQFFDISSLVLVNSDIDAQEPLNSVQMLDLKSFLKHKKLISPLRNLRGILIVEKKFWEGKGSLVEIFDSLWEDGKKMLPVLAWDKHGLFWEILESEMGALVKFVTPLSDFIPFFHAYKYSQDREEGLRELDKLVRKKGLLSRTWKRPSKVKKNIREFIKIIEEKNDFQSFLHILENLLRGEIYVEDVYTYMMYAIPVKNEELKIEYLHKNGFLPSDKLKNILSSIETINTREIVKDILFALKKAEMLWFPEISITEILDLSYGEPYTLKSLNNWLEKQHNKLLEVNYDEFLAREKIPHELLPLLKFIVILLSSKIEAKTEVTSLLIRYILSLNNRLKYLSISLISNVLSTIQLLSEEEINTAIFLQRFLEVHGPEPYLLLATIIFGNKILNCCFLCMLINSNQGIGPRKIIAKALQNKEVLSKLGKLSLRLPPLRPHGFTAPLPWELDIKINERTLKRAESSIKYFKDVGLEPPKPLIYIRKIVEMEKEMFLETVNLKNVSLDHLGSYYTVTLHIYGSIEGLKDFLVKTYGFSDIKVIRAIENRAIDIKAKISKEIERRFIMEYNELLERENMFVSETIKLAKRKVGQDKPIILLVIDGMRYDDYLNKIKPALMESGLKIVHDQYLLSHLPSITTHSRRSIFSSEKPPKILVFPFKTAGYVIKTEEDYLKDLDPRSLYIKGSIGEINLKLKNMIYTDELKNKKFLAIVMSDLEKAAHGSAEGFLAHITYDYAKEIAQIAKNAIETFYSVNKEVPYLILVSDHGLEKFTKVVSLKLEDFKRELKKRGLVDPVHEIVITPRYMIIPTLSSESANRIHHILPKKELEGVWIKKGNELALEKVALKIKGEKIFELIPGDRVVFVFPRGEERFKTGPTRSVVYHGGASPSEIFVPFSIITY